MNDKTIGKFLSVLRKANGYTQQQVADILCVSNKTISKWECDDGYPEITMLPAIAELYGVTVDEILKGERIEKAKEESDSTIRKTEERTKLLIEKINLKFKNNCIISVALGVLAAFLSVICDYFISGENYWFVFIVIFGLLLGSVITALICRNNYLSSIIAPEVDEATVNKAKSKANLLVSVEIFFVLTTVFTVLSIAFGFFYFVFAIVFVSLVISVIVDFYFDGKIEGKRFAEIKKLREKTTKTLIITTSVIILLSAITPFGLTFLEHATGYSYCFIDAVDGFNYETEEQAIEDYNNLKACFTEGREIYYVYEFYPDGSESYIQGYKYELLLTQTDNGYKIESFGYSDENVGFESLDKYNEFIKNNTIKVELINILPCHINDLTEVTFDDEIYTVNYSINTTSHILNAAEDILPVFYLTGSVACFTAFVIVTVIYHKKKKEINNN